MGARTMTMEEANRIAQQRIAELEAEIERLKKNYHDLLYQVATKHPNETRHETAKRYIQQAENRTERAEAAQQEGK